MVDISNCFPVNLKTIEKNKEKHDEEHSSKDVVYDVDMEYLQKMIRFHKQLNDQEAVLGVYISSTKLDNQSMIIIAYFRDLFLQQKIRSTLQSPIFLTFDPELNNNKLEIKILNIHSFYFEKCPIFSEMPFKFKLDNFGSTGVDVLFYGQDHLDTMSILNDRREISHE